MVTGAAADAAFRWVHLGVGTLRDGLVQLEGFMTADSKTPLDHVNDTLTQLKEMRHYAKNNVERLTAQWLLFDGELAKLKEAAKIEDLMTRQAEFYDALEAVIAELEEWVVKLTPAPEEGQA